jgi:integrase
MSDIKTIVHLGNKNAPNLPLPPDKMNVIYWDDTDTGFGRRLWRDRKGRVHAAWIIQYRTHSGIQRRMTFARGNLPAHKARKLAIEQLARTKVGDDPQGDKATKRAKRSRVFKAVAEDFIKHGEKFGIKSRPWRRETARQYRYILFEYYKQLHGMEIDAITRGDIARLNNRILHERGRRSASIARSRIWTLYHWALGQGLVDNNPVIGTTKIEYTEKRERVLSNDELRRIWLACGPENSPHGGRFGHIIRMLILTGARRSEITGMTWGEVDLDSGIWTLPAERSKNNRKHELPLPPTALGILQELSEQKRWNGKNWAVDGYVFSAHGRRLNIDRKKAELMKACGVKNWWIHDIRRSVATGMGGIGIQPHVIECVLNHVSGFRGGVGGVYNKATYDPEVVQALARWNEHILALVEGRADKVVPIRTYEARRVVRESQHGRTDAGKSNPRASARSLQPRRGCSRSAAC